MNQSGWCFQVNNNSACLQPRQYQYKLWLQLLQCTLPKNYVTACVRVSASTVLIFRQFLESHHQALIKKCQHLIIMSVSIMTLFHIYLCCHNFCFTLCRNYSMSKIQFQTEITTRWKLDCYTQLKCNFNQNNHGQ